MIEADWLNKLVYFTKISKIQKNIDSIEKKRVNPGSRDNNIKINRKSTIIKTFDIKIK